MIGTPPRKRSQHHQPGPSKISTFCPSCGYEYSVARNLKGRPLKCLSCRQSFVVEELPTHSIEDLPVAPRGLPWNRNRVLPVAIMVGIVLVGAVWRLAAPPTKEVVADEPVLVMSAQELYDAYMQLGEDCTLTGTLVTLSGETGYVSRPIQSPFITFKASQLDKRDVHCSLENAPPAHLQAGRYATITGRIKGEIGGCVYIENCKVVN